MQIKPKELWKTFALNINKTVQQDTNSVFWEVEGYFSIFEGHFLKKFPKLPNKYNLNTVIQH